MIILTTADLFSALEIFVVGWGGIFVVMGVLYFAIKLLLRAFPPADEEEWNDPSKKRGELEDE